MNSLPTLVHKDGPQNAVEMQKAGKGGKSFTHKVEANSQRRIDQKNRTEEVVLNHQFRFYDVEQKLFNVNLKKQELTCKRRLQDYHRKLYGSAGKRESKKSKSALERDQKWSLSSFNLEDLRSIRRSTKPMDAGAFLNEGLADLHRMETRHKKQYSSSMDAIRRLEERVGTGVNLTIPRRSYSPPEVTLAPSAIISHFRRSIRLMEAELTKVKAKNGNVKQGKTALMRDDGKSPTRSESTRIGCAGHEKEKSSGEPASERSTTVMDMAKLRLLGAPLSDIDKIPKGNLKLYSKVVTNPYGAAPMPASARSRLLMEAKKDDTMYVWLGFRSRDQMLKTLKGGDGKIQQIPEALLDILEDGDDDSQPDLDNFVESESEKEDEDDEDPRFQIFDRKKVLFSEKTSPISPAKSATPKPKDHMDRPSLGVKKHTVA